MKEIWYLAFALLVTPAFAQDAVIEQLDAAKRAHVEKVEAEAVAGATVDSVDGINVRVDLKPVEGAPVGRPGAQTDVVLKPGDPEFDAVLAAAKAAAARKAARAGQELEAAGVTVDVKPVEEAPVEVPVEEQK